MKTCAFPFFRYVVYQSFRLCYRRSIQKKEYRRADKYHSQYAVKPACLPAAYIPYDKPRVLGGNEPIPTEECRQQGANSRHRKDTLNDVLAHVVRLAVDD